MKKKRLLGIMLSLSLMLGLMSGMNLTSYADTDITKYDLWVGGVQVTSANASNITGSDTPTASYDAETRTLTLNNYVNSDGIYKWEDDYYDDTYSAAIYAEDDLTIELEGENTAANKSTSEDYPCGVYCKKDLTITGGGELNTSGRYGIYVSDGDMTINNSTVTANGGRYEGIFLYGKITINDSEVKASSTGNDGLDTDYLEMNSGSLYAGTTCNNFYGIEVDCDSYINGGTVNAVSTGANGKGFYVECKLTINGGEVTASGTKHGIEVDHDAYINGGIVNAESTGANGTGLYVYWRLTINGGEVTASGTEQGIESERKFTIADILAVKAGNSDTDNQSVEISDFVKTHDQKWVNIREIPAAKVTTAPKAKDLTATGSAQELVTAGAASDGLMNYAVGSDGVVAPTVWGEAIPKGTEKGTYHVWYKAKGSEGYRDSDPECVDVTIADGGSGGDPAEEVKAVVDMLSALPNPEKVTVNDEKAIKAARAAYDDLSGAQKKDPSLTTALKNKLADCEAALAEAKKSADEKAAEAVSKDIKGLPKSPSKADETKARSVIAEYDKLTDAQKALLGDDMNYQMAEYKYFFGKKDAAVRNTSMSSAKAMKGRKAQIRWAENSEASGYQLVYSTSKKFTKKTTKKVTVRSNATVKKTVRKLKAGKKYYFKVRPYTTLQDPASGSNGNVYGKWSNVKKIKAKK